MKKIKNSTKIFAFLGLAVVTVAAWQTVLASRVAYDIYTWKKAASDEELAAKLKDNLKSYREVPVRAFSKLFVEDGVVVQVVKSEHCGVYRSSYDRARVDIREESGILYISSKKAQVWWNGRNTPIFVLMPPELEE